MNLLRCVPYKVCNTPGMPSEDVDHIVNYREYSQGIIDLSKHLSSSTVFENLEKLHMFVHNIRTTDDVDW